MRRRNLLYLVGGLAGGLAGAGGAATWNWLTAPAVPQSRTVAAAATRAETQGDGSRLPTGAKVLLIGDSIFAGNTFGLQGDNFFALTHNASGEVAWAYMTDPRFRFDVWEQSWDREIRNVLWDGYNMGIGGSRSIRLENAAEIEHLRALEPDIVVVGFGANDIALGSSASDFNTRLTTFCDEMIRNDGRKVVVALVRPHVVSGANEAVYDYPEGDRKWDVHFAINDYITQVLPTRYEPGELSVWDTFTPLADPQSYRGGEFVPAFTRDGVHLSDVGAFHSGATLLPILDALIEPGTHFDADPAVENLLPNGRLEGAVVRAFPGVEGLVPNGWEISRTLGETAQLTLSSAADEASADQALVLDFTATDDTTVNEFTINFYPGRFAAREGMGGRFMQLYVPVEIEAYSRFVYVTSFLADDQYVRFSEGLRFLSRTESNWHGQPFSGWIITPPLQLPEEAAGFRAGLVVRMLGGGEGVCRIRIRPAVIARLMDDPRPEEWRL